MSSWSPGNAAAVGRDVCPPVVGDGRETPQYANVFVKEVSSKWYIKYREYCSDVASCNDIGYTAKGASEP